MIDEKLSQSQQNYCIPALATVEPIGVSERQIFRSLEDIEKYVEAPAVPACMDFFDKNIRTVSSSANGKNGVYIDIDFATLSDNNKLLALELGEPINKAKDGSFDIVKILIPDEEIDSEEDAANRLYDKAKCFESQKLTWAPVYSLLELKQVYGYAEDQAVKIDDFTELGFYFDEKEDKFYESEELFNKVHS